MRIIVGLVSRLLVLLALFTLIAVAQEPQKSPANPTRPAQKEDPQPSKPATGSDNSRRSPLVLNKTEDYKIGITDTLDIRIVDAEELSGQRRVMADGTIKLPFLGRVMAVDKTTDQLATEIAKGLQGKYLFDPRVNVEVLEYNSRMIFVQGAVLKPGVVSAEGRPDLLQVIALSGGLLPNHSSTAFVIRRRTLTEEDIKQREADLKQEEADLAKDPDQPRLKDAQWLARQYTMVRLKISGLYKGNFDQNMYLEPNDIVTIPPTDLFFVSGAVKAPGSFQLKDGTTLRQALALSQGTISTANPDGTLIFRENPETGERLEIKAPAGKIMAGKEPDMPIYPNDVVIVPSSKWKSVVYPLANIMAYSVVTTLLLSAFY